MTDCSHVNFKETLSYPRELMFRAITKRRAKRVRDEKRGTKGVGDN